MEFLSKIAQIKKSGTFFSPDQPVCISRSPGRLDLMGGNDDYTGGLVFESTIRDATFAAAQICSGPMIELNNTTAAEAGWQGRMTVSWDEIKDEQSV